jgi:hypothetical protein
MRKNDKLEDTGVDENITLRLIFTKLDGAWTGSVWLRTGTVDGHFCVR